MSMYDFAVTDTTPGGPGGTSYFGANGQQISGQPAAAYNGPATVSNDYVSPAATPSSPGYVLPDSAGTGTTSARASLNSFLDQYGLASLGDTVWGWYLSGVPMEQILLDLRKTPEYKQRFPGMDALATKGRAISETDYIKLERQYVSLFRQAGLPEGFYDQPADFASFIANDVSPAEMGSRLDMARRVVYEEPPEVRNELQRLYGITTGDIMSIALDASAALPIIEARVNAGEAAAASSLSGYGALTQAEAEQVATARASFGDLSQGFDTLAQSGELFQPIIGEADTGSLSRSEQLGSVFNGNTAAARRIQQKAKQRAAVFAGGGGQFAETNRGISGLGSANT